MPGSIEACCSIVKQAQLVQTQAAGYGWCSWQESSLSRFCDRDRSPGRPTAVLLAAARLAAARRGGLRSIADVAMTTRTVTLSAIRMQEDDLQGKQAGWRLRAAAAARRGLNCPQLWRAVPAPHASQQLQMLFCGEFTHYSSAISLLGGHESPGIMMRRPVPWCKGWLLRPTTKITILLNALRGVHAPGCNAHYPPCVRPA